MRILRAFVQIICTVIAPASFSNADAVSDPATIAEVLGLIAVRSEANFDKISTWKGIYAVSIRQLRAEPHRLKSDEAKWDGERYWMSTSGEVEFDVDFPQSLLRVEYKHLSPPSFHSLAANMPIPFNVGSRHEITIFNSEEHWDFEPDTRFGELKDFPIGARASFQNGRVAFRKPPPRDRTEIVSLRGGRVNPQEFFGNGSSSTWAHCVLFAKTIVEGGFTPAQLSRLKLDVTGSDGNRFYELTWTYDPDTPNEEDALTTRQVFAEEFAFNLVEFEKQRSQKVYERRKFTYAQKGGIFYPSRIECTGYSPEGDEVDSRLYTEKESFFNEPFPAGTFTFASLSLTNGERIADEIEAALFAYKDGHLIPYAEYVPIAEGGGPNSRLLFIANFAGIVVLACFLTYRYWKAMTPLRRS